MLDVIFHPEAIQWQPNFTHISHTLIAVIFAAASNEPQSDWQEFSLEPSFIRSTGVMSFGHRFALPYSLERLYDADFGLITVASRRRAQWCARRVVLVPWNGAEAMPSLDELLTDAEEPEAERKQNAPTRFIRVDSCEPAVLPSGEYWALTL